ncbi:YciI-like protein [Galbibacter sp. EGI 63066]|uniref:YciI-like protein n=1 Tax=Galbibacter sp. EGI 63066 TaxID=2993559 RepID=UPI002248D8D0|nr:YciI-like protein [Galbibacter sp. EGI 63066]MCX2681236.1 YciI-like protein [Galbibacter sp. EGI 63066]
MYYILFYKTIDDYIEKRAPFRAEHLALAQEATKSGALVLAGALDDPADGAVLVFKGNSPKVAEDFAKNDPYVKNGLISEWSVRPWTVVIGSLFKTP